MSRSPAPLSRTPGAVKRVTSLQNPIIKAVRALHQRKARAETGLFLAEGHKLVVDALSVGWVPQMIVALERAEEDGAQDLAARVRAAGGDVVWTNGAVLEKIARRDNPQTVIGVFEQRFAAIDTLSAGTVVALEAPRDPGNIGTIVRTADGAGAAGVVLLGQSADPFGLETVRATMGSIFHVPIARADLSDLSRYAREAGARVVGTHLAGSVDVRTVKGREPQILLMGTEQAGLTQEAAALCDTLVRIPMAGAADSLNLAVATGIALYELRRPFL